MKQRATGGATNADDNMLLPTSYKEKITMRKFDTGATRDNDDSKIDYWGFISPYALEAFGKYMTKHRVQADGALRASDNWKQGIPQDSYQRSLYRHVQDWKRAIEADNRAEARELASAIFFNLQGWMHEEFQPKTGGEVMVKSAMEGTYKTLNEFKAANDLKNVEGLAGAAAEGREATASVANVRIVDYTRAMRRSRPNGSPAVIRLK